MTLSEALTVEIPRYIEKYMNKLIKLVSPYVEFNFYEFADRETLQRSEAFYAIENYLSDKCSMRARRLKVNVPTGSNNNGQSNFMLTVHEHEEVTDEYEAVKIWWYSDSNAPRMPSFSVYPPPERRFYTLSIHKRHRDLITDAYLDHVLKEGRAIAARHRQRKLYTNIPKHAWRNVVFNHNATFDTLAMATSEKDEIKKELTKFRNGKEYYARIGKAWKRGYLLYGPPGTGKSTMVAAMANFLNYDVYDLELSTVKDNSELRQLLLLTRSKSIIVIEDIDCSLDLTGRRKDTKKKDKDKAEEEEDPFRIKDEEESKSKVTLSGLLNCIDGIWSSCGEEKIIVFTTNHKDKLDPALIRRGRMDRHIEMSYCCFEGFKVLAKNYLGVESHILFPKIEDLLKETKMIPADVAEKLTPISDDEAEKTVCLEKLIAALEAAKELEALKKSEEEDRLKAEKEAQEKQEYAQEEIEDKVPSPRGE